MLTNGADAAELVAGWQRRLIALAETPEHLFRDTPRHLIEEEQRRRTTLAGYAEAEVADAAARAVAPCAGERRATVGPGSRAEAVVAVLVGAAACDAASLPTVDPTTGLGSVGS